MLFKKKDKKPKPQTRILIVDDDVPSRELMGILLGDYGLCSFAANGTEAIKAFESGIEAREPFGLVCLDIMMPEMDGLETLKKIRDVENTCGIESNDKVTVIMTTTASQESKVMRAFHYGCCGYLVKPISKEALIREMKKTPLTRSTNARWRGR